MAVSCSNGIKRISQEFLFKNGCVFFSAFLLCFPLSLAGTITVINDPVRKALGDDVTLDISTDESVLVCTWHRGIIDVTNFILRVANGVHAEGSQYTRRESFALPSHSLRIANATLADSGTYSVRILFTSGNEVQSNLTLKVLDSRLENGFLSAGAIAGISIGVVVSVALILTVGAVLLKKLRMHDENKSNGNDARTYENANVSNRLPIYENNLSDVHYQGKTGRTVESEASVYTDLQYKSDSTYSELERSKKT